MAEEKTESSKAQPTAAKAIRKKSTTKAKKVVVPNYIFLTPNKGQGNKDITAKDFKKAAEYLCSGAYSISVQNSDWQFRECTLTYQGLDVVTHMEADCGCGKK